jgi:hypothetical protein
MADILRFLASRLAFLLEPDDELRAASARAALEAASRPTPHRTATK